MMLCLENKTLAYIVTKSLYQHPTLESGLSKFKDEFNSLLLSHDFPSPVYPSLQ